MMREYQIYSPWVDIKILSQNGCCHSWALNMPAWSSLSPRRLPFGLIWLSGFPKYKILFASFLTFLVCLLLFSFSLFYSLQLSILEIFRLKCFNIEVNWFIWFITIPIRDNLLYKGNDLWNVLCNSCYIIWISYSKFSHIIEKVILPLFCELKVLDSLLVWIICFLYNETILRYRSQAEEQLDWPTRWVRPCWR